MATNPTATLTSMLRAATITDHEEILKAANSALKVSKGNEDALRTRAVALLNLDRFEDALRALDDGGDKLAERCVLEKSYALYKTGQLADAYDVIKKTPGSARSRGLNHVAAQVAYRSERFEDAAKMYRALSAVSDDAVAGEENDLRINSSAVDVQLEWQGKGGMVSSDRKKPGREDLEAFETTYNFACGCIARGDYGAGNMLLKRARDLCESLDDLSDEEKKAEVLPIMVQHAYVLTKLGKYEDAERIQHMIVVSDVPEPPTRTIAQNNAIAISRQQENPYLIQRLLSSGPKLSKGDKLFTNQETTLQRNKYVIDLQSQKHQGVASSTRKNLLLLASQQQQQQQQQTTTTTPSPPPRPLLSSAITGLSALNAAAIAGCQWSPESLKRLLAALERRPRDLGLLLTVVQLYVLAGKPGLASNLLESFFARLEEKSSSSSDDRDVRFAPGLVALAVALHRSQGRRAPAKAELARAAAHWRGQQQQQKQQQAQQQTSSSPSPPPPSSSSSSFSSSSSSSALLRAAGLAIVGDASSGPSELRAASDIFADLRARDPADRVAVAGLVAANATNTDATTGGPDVASALLDKRDLARLTPVEELVAGVDAEALEAAGVAVSAPVENIEQQQQNKKKRAAAAMGGPAAEAASTTTTTKKKRRLRASKTPKVFEEGKKMDPERWLPMRDRSSYRPKGGKKGKKRAAEATQGGLVREEEHSGGADVGATAEKGAAGGGGGGGAKKKKKKGKK